MESLTSETYGKHLELFFNEIKSSSVAESKKFAPILKRYFSDLSLVKRTFDLYKRQTDRYLSSDFRLFKYFRTDENALSDYIAMMLDKKWRTWAAGPFFNFIHRFPYCGKSWNTA